MAVTYLQFQPAPNQNFGFQPTLDGQQYTAIVTWNLFGQRWVLNIYTLQGVLVLQKPLTGSPLDYDINLVKGYFTTSSLVYRVASNNIEITS